MAPPPEGSGIPMVYTEIFLEGPLTLNSVMKVSETYPTVSLKGFSGPATCRRIMWCRYVLPEPLEVLTRLKSHRVEYIHEA